MACCSNFPMNKFAYEGAMRIPIAVPCTCKYTWFFENRVNESFIFFEVVLILKDTASKLRSKEVFLFMSAVFLHLLQQLVA